MRVSATGAATAVDGPNRTTERAMTLLEKLLRRKKPSPRVQVCVECGMPVGEHKDWCSIERLRDRYESSAKE
jgi:hypothetical protein